MSETTGKRILVVDDNEEILSWMEFVLQRHEYDVILARDGGEALVRAQRDSPDLIILDIVMPIRSGLSVLERLRANDSCKARIMIVTAKTEERHRQYAESRGADAFMRKPFEVDVFLETVEELLKDC